VSWKVWNEAIQDAPVQHHIAVLTLETSYRYPRVLATET
jgi:hypothetical protein